MFKKIVVPLDLAHVERLQKALHVAAGLAREHGASICYIGVTTATPGPIARTPEEFSAKLEAFAKAQGLEQGVKTEAHMLVSHDPAVQMDRELEAAVTALGADLVVMASHVPNVTDYVWSGHGAHLAAHSAASVMLIRA